MKGWNYADKELSGITPGRKSLDRVLDQNNEKLNNVNKENQLSSINLDKDAFLLIVLNGNSCHIENIQDFDELEDLLSKTIPDDNTQVPSNLDTLNTPIKANALAATEHEFKANPCTVAIDDSTDPVIVINSTATLTNSITISTTCTATDFATAATLLDATNVSRAARHNSTESTFPETTDIDTQRAENEPNVEHIEAFSDPNNHNMNEGRKRRKTTDTKNWKRNLNKKLRMEGKSYTGFRTDDLKKIHQDTLREIRKIKTYLYEGKMHKIKNKKVLEIFRDATNSNFSKILEFKLG